MCIIAHMKDLIIIGGKAPESIALDLGSYRRIIAADSGYDTARRLSISPDIVVGDFDSTALSAELEAMGYEACPRDKDDTDAAIAIKSSCGCYDLIGGGEGRIDHTLSLLAAFRCLSAPQRWLMASDSLISSSGAISFSAPVGTGLSIFPLESASVTTHGLRWDMDGMELSSSFISQSNRTVSDTVSVESSDLVFLRFFPEEFPSVRFC